IDEFSEYVDQLDEPEVTLDRAFEKVAESYPMTKKEIGLHLERLVVYGEPEVLSREWIDEHVDYADVRGGTQAFIHAEDLQNLLVPKQEDVEGYEKQTEETETVAKVFADYLIASAKFKLALGMEVKELNE